MAFHLAKKYRDFNYKSVGVICIIYNVLFKFLKFIHSIFIPLNISLIKSREMQRGRFFDVKTCLSLKKIFAFRICQ